MAPRPYVSRGLFGRGHLMANERVLTVRGNMGTMMAVGTTYESEALLCEDVPYVVVRVYPNDGEQSEDDELGVTMRLESAAVSGETEAGHDVLERTIEIVWTPIAGAVWSVTKVGPFPAVFTFDIDDSHEYVRLQIEKDDYDGLQGSLIVVGDILVNHWQWRHGFRGSGDPSKAFTKGATLEYDNTDLRWDKHAKRLDLT